MTLSCRRRLGISQGDVLEVIKTRTAEEQARDHAILADIESRVSGHH